MADTAAVKKPSLKEIDTLLKAVTGSTGDGKIDIKPAQYYRTGIPTIDWALGGGRKTGGFPMGHMTEIFGENATGKTTLTYAAIAQTQRDFPNRINLLFDYERTCDPDYIQACGVKLDNATFRIVRPATLEDGLLEILYPLVMRQADLGMVVVDSLAAMNPRGQLEKIKKDGLGSTVAEKARVMSELIRAYVPELMNTTAALVFINHQIANIKMGFAAPGTPDKVTPGGNALKFNAVLRVFLKDRGMINAEGQSLDGQDLKMGLARKVELYVDKNKLGSPWQRVQYQIRAGEGIDMVTSLLATAMDQGVVVKTKNTLTVDLKGFEDIKAIGLEAMRQTLRTNEKLFTAVADTVAAKLSTVEFKKDLSVSGDEDDGKSGEVDL